ncbi:hypothetical protein [Undibacterium sp. TC9W]|uniref:hypothetical protein n=1 Tax=Undibacterium sp. TC9W TaxID=3413053 RepID=UPI003BF383B3
MIVEVSEIDKSFQNIYMKTSKIICKVLSTSLHVLLFFSWTSGALAFDVDGYRAGMTNIELENAINRNGFKYIALENSGIVAAVVNNNGKVTDIAASFVVCKGKLSLYQHSLDFERDYVTQMEILIRDHGTPTSVTVFPRPFVGISNTYSKVLSSTWNFGSDQITLEMTPEVRDGKGALLFNKSANITYSKTILCN